MIGEPDRSKLNLKPQPKPEGPRRSMNSDMIDPQLFAPGLDHHPSPSPTYNSTIFMTSVGNSAPKPILPPISTLLQNDSVPEPCTYQSTCGATSSLDLSSPMRGLVSSPPRYFSQIGGVVTATEGSPRPLSDDGDDDNLLVFKTFLPDHACGQSGGGDGAGKKMAQLGAIQQYGSPSSPSRPEFEFKTQYTAWKPSQLAREYGLDAQIRTAPPRSLASSSSTHPISPSHMVSLRTCIVDLPTGCQASPLRRQYQYSYHCAEPNCDTSWIHDKPDIQNVVLDHYRDQHPLVEVNCEKFVLKKSHGIAVPEGFLPHNGCPAATTTASTTDGSAFTYHEARQLCPSTPKIASTQFMSGQVGLKSPQASDRFQKSSFSSVARATAQEQDTVTLHHHRATSIPEAFRPTTPQSQMMRQNAAEHQNAMPLYLQPGFVPRLPCLVKMPFSQVMDLHMSDDEFRLNVRHFIYQADQALLTVRRIFFAHCRARGISESAFDSERRKFFLSRLYSLHDFITRCNGPFKIARERIRYHGDLAGEFTLMAFHGLKRLYVPSDGIWPDSDGGKQLSFAELQRRRRCCEVQAAKFSMHTCETIRDVWGCRLLASKS